MSGHFAEVVETAYWMTRCGVCGETTVAQSEGHAEFLADEHYRDTNCTCWDSLSMEFSPEPCPTCKRTAS